MTMKTWINVSKRRRRSSRRRRRRRKKRKRRKWRRSWRRRRRRRGRDHCDIGNGGFGSGKKKGFQTRTSATINRRRRTK